MRDATEDADTDQWWIDLKIEHWVGLFRHLILLHRHLKVLDDLLLMNQLNLLQQD